MNSIWNKNISLFSQRFPSLAKELNLLNMTEPEFDFWEVLPSKAGELTAKENGLLLHSAYNPLREAESAVKTIKSENIWAAAFFSMGLGYAPLEYAKTFPDETIIIVEPSPDFFFAALKYTDFETLFKHKSLILLLEAQLQEVTALIEGSAGFNHTAVIENKNQTAHARSYFDSLKALIERNKQKVKINSATLEKFSRLWLKNSCKNIKAFGKLEGVKIYTEKCPPDLPVLLVSAGPTLSEVLPHLKELKKRMLIVAVDTALRACLKNGVEPDFIVLTDPQYYAWRHIAGLKSPSSVLITESAAWPSVYRFNCRKTVLCSSLFPLGQFFEKKLGEKGQLGSGGSVSTTAWDFARLTGTKNIYCAGLDLGYPRSESHIRGSLFEEASHLSSCRTKTSEQKLALSLFSSGKESVFDYDGKPLFTDSKMKMFAWWFESQAQKFTEVNSWSLSSKSFAIPGFKVKNTEELLNLKEAEELKKVFFEAEKNASTSMRTEYEESFNRALKELNEGFEELYSLAKKGQNLCSKMLSNSNPQKEREALKELEQTDNLILHSKQKEAASLVFPTESRLNKIFEETVFPQDKSKALFLKSKIIYTELLESIRLYKKYL